MGNIQAYQTSSPFPMDDVPEVILENILSFVPDKDLIKNCTLVCKSWQTLINNKSLWKMKLDRKLFPETVSALQACNDVLDYRKVCLLKPFARNLVKNWNAEDGLEHWHIESNSGDGFRVESDSGGNGVGCVAVSSIVGLQGCRKCWATSYGWCSKEQFIDLWKEGLTPKVLNELKPEIIFNEWVAARFDCAVIYNCQIFLLDENKKLLPEKDTHQFECQWEENQWTGGKSWHKIEHTFKDYKDGVRYVRVSHRGKDRQFWAGHYGAKFTGTSITVQITPECIAAWRERKTS